MTPHLPSNIAIASWRPKRWLVVTALLIAGAWSIFGATAYVAECLGNPHDTRIRLPEGYYFVYWQRYTNDGFVGKCLQLSQDFDYQDCSAEYLINENGMLLYNVSEAACQTIASEALSYVIIQPDGNVRYTIPGIMRRQGSDSLGRIHLFELAPGKALPSGSTFSLEELYSVGRIGFPGEDGFPCLKRVQYKVVDQHRIIHDYSDQAVFLYCKPVAMTLKERAMVWWHSR